MTFCGIKRTVGVGLMWGLLAVLIFEVSGAQAHASTGLRASGGWMRIGEARTQDVRLSGRLIKVSTDTLWVIEETVRFEKDTRLDSAEVADAFWGSPGLLIGSPDSLSVRPAEEIAGRNGHPDSQRERSPTYDALLGKLIQHLSQNSGATLGILADEAHVTEARTLHKMLTGNRYVRADQVSVGIFQTRSKRHRQAGELNRALKVGESRLTIDPPFIRFQTSEGLQRTPVDSWRLQVRNPEGQIIKVVAEKGAFPGEIVWEWKDEPGLMRTPGHYSYAVTWKSPEGMVHTAVAGYIKVIRKVRHVTYKLTRFFELPLSGGGSLFLMVR